MDVENLLGKLHTHKEGAQIPTPPTPKTLVPKETRIDRPAQGGNKMTDDYEGIIIDLGEGISLNLPIQKRMSLSDFIKLAEKVKALEMLSESQDGFRHNQL